MYLIGLTGGIASGKSVVSRRLAEHGAVHIDADGLAREVVEPGTPGLAAIARRFGPSVVAADGSLDRPALGAIIFTDPAARADLNAITHPAIQKLARERMEAAAAADPHAVVVYDVPLLAERITDDRYHRFDLVVVVEADDDVRIGRLVGIRGLSPDEAAKRLASQASNAERRQIADVVIDSNGTLDDTLRQADELWQTVRARA
ncbi:MAG: dephospho-CoA kinase [Actinomycetota bacterium]